jgi:hypothetical protein
MEPFPSHKRGLFFKRGFPLLGNSIARKKGMGMVNFIEAVKRPLKTDFMTLILGSFL